MNTTASFNIVRLFVVLGVLFGASIPPVFASSYTWAGQTFSSYEEMQEYMREYIRVRNELYGITPSTSVRTTTSSTKTNTTQSSLVKTRSVDMIGVSGARLSGSVDSVPKSDTKVWFEYGTTPTALWFATAPEVLDASFGEKKFDRNVTELMHDTTYYYRAVRENSNGARAYGIVAKFTTLADTKNRDSWLRVSTGGVKEVKDDRVTFTAGTTLAKDATRGAVWFEYGDSPDDLYKKTPSTEVLRASVKEGVTYTVRSLDEATEYYYRAVGYDARGIKNYGVIKKFTTPKDIVDEKPKVVTNRASDVGPYSATLGGSVAMNDFKNGSVFVVYGEDRTVIANVPKLYNTYTRIKAQGDALQKVLLDADLDREDVYTTSVQYLDFSTTHYYALGVAYEDGDGAKHIVLGGIQSFVTKKP
jgi:hypothetical protein